MVGGGKLSRQKYDDKAMQAVTSTLKQLNFVEDRGASCIIECGGCYKTQHDTAKNIMTVVVFPKILDDNGNKKDVKHQTNNPGEEEGYYEPLIPTNSPGYKLAVCSLTPTFHNLLSTYCPTYFEKKECLKCLEGLLQVEQAIEDKMMTGKPLDGGEQAFYDESSDLKEKYATLQREVSKHIEEGRLTAVEKEVLVEMNEKRIATLMAEKSSASVAEKLKKALARKQQLQSLTDDVLSMNVSYPPPLRHESQLTTLRKKLLPLQALEESSRGRLLTLSETRSLTEKEEIESEIERLEMASCGWFEDEDIFEERLQRSRDKFDAKFARTKRSGGGGKASISKAGGGKSGGGNAVNKWILPGEKPKNAWGASSGKNKMKGKGGAVFTAMMMDSSSDEEEDSDEEIIPDTKEKKSYASPSPKKQHPAASNVLTPVSPSSNKDEKATKETTNTGDTQSKKNNKKKKKKKGKKAATTVTEQDVIPDVEETTEETKQAVISKQDSPSSVSSSLLEFWQSFLLPFIKWLLTFFLSLITSMFKGNEDKKGKKKKKRG